MDAPSQTTADTVWAVMKDFATPLLTAVAVLGGGVVTYFTTKLKTRSEEHLADEKQEQDREHNALIASIQINDSHTRQFQALLEGYQKHVDQLTKEVHSLRREVTRLRTALATRLSVCKGCEKFAEWQVEFGEAMNPLDGDGDD